MKEPASPTPLQLVREAQLITKLTVNGLARKIKYHPRSLRLFMAGGLKFGKKITAKITKLIGGTQ